MIPILAGGFAAVLIVIGVVVWSNQDDGDTVVADEPTTTTAVENDTETSLAPTTSAPSEPATTEPLVETTAPETTLATTEPTAETTTVEQAAPSTCTGNRYSVTLPSGWFEQTCTIFSPIPINIPGEAEYRPEIDMSFTTAELYPAALARINSTMTVLSQTATTVDGLPATLFVIEEEWFDVGLRSVFVVDAGDGVFFASANELVDSGVTVTDFDAHYNASVTALQTMMASISITPGVAPQNASCAGPTLTNPVASLTVSADVNNDGTIDQLSIVRHANGAHLVADAGAAGTISGPIGFADPAGADILHLTDLDGDGVPEIFSSTSGSASGSNYESFHVNGCSIDPIGGAVQPALQQGASVTAATSFGCAPSASGAQTIENYGSTLDQATSLFDNNYRQFSYGNGQWTLVAETDAQGPSPVLGPGPETCV